MRVRNLFTTGYTEDHRVSRAFPRAPCVPCGEEFFRRLLDSTIRGVSVEHRLHPLRGPHAHRQVWRLAGLAHRRRYGRRRRQSRHRTRRHPAQRDRRNHLRQRPPGWRRSQSRPPDFHPQRRAAGGPGLHRQQSVRLGHQVDRARLSGNRDRQSRLRARGRNRIDVARFLIISRARAGDTVSAIRNSSTACTATASSAPWRKC